LASGAPHRFASTRTSQGASNQKKEERPSLTGRRVRDPIRPKKHMPGVTALKRRFCGNGTGCYRGLIAASCGRGRGATTSATQQFPGLEPRLPLEHDHKLFPRPLNAIIDLGNTNPDLGGSHRGMGVEIGAGLSGGEPAPT
jgi:hypothetical protein